MALFPYDPFRHLENWRRDMDRFFTEGFPIGMTRTASVPVVDVYESGNDVVAEFEIPGVDKQDDIHIDVDDNILTVSGTINRMMEVNEHDMHRRERYVGRFQRSVSLPARVDPAASKASYKNGVLEVRMPKISGETGHRINVDFH
ncbi:MAG: Hsp20/alpha crystallin family protein [Bacillota bacterium]